MNDGLDITHG